MLKEIILNGRPIRYNLQRKKVKNINIRIKRDLTVNVSASSRVPESEIERILRDKEKFILSAIEKYERLSYVNRIDSDPLSGATVFGQYLKVSITEGKKTSASITADTVAVTLKNASDRKESNPRKNTAKIFSRLCRF